MGVGNNPNVYLYSATRLELVLEAVLRLRPRALVVDSIQTVYLDDLPSSAGSVVQVRECASALLQVAKRERIPVFLVGHVTKSGDIAGPRVLEHIVDVVVYMEGGRQQAVRLVRCVKNRYGATDEVGVFSMEDAGLKAVANPSALFLSARDSPISVSSAVTVVMEGTRPLVMEVQALCSPVPPGSGAPPIRAPTGVKKERLWLILAVLGKHTSIRPYGVDVHINVTGGLTVTEPAADLAIAAAIASSYYERPLDRHTALIAEVGLGGELRGVTQLERRVAEAIKLGFKRVVIPAKSDLKMKGKLAGAQLIECQTVKEAFDAALGPVSEGARSRKPRSSGSAAPRRTQQQQYAEDEGEAEELY
jgi:DNA repair protein RadA/Sms